MMILGAERERQIDALRLPEEQRRLTRGEPSHPALVYCCRKLAFSNEPEDFSPPGLDVVPLWEGENSITGFFVNHQGQRIFIIYDVEYIDRYSIIGLDFKSVIGKLVADHVDEEDMRAVVASLGCPLAHLDHVR